MVSNVLIIDDEVDVQRTIQAVLDNEGISTEVATNKEEIDEKIKKIDSFDVVLLDILMPELSGYEVLKKIKEANPDSKVLFLSIIHQREVGSMHIDGFIQKPFTPESLLRELYRCSNET